MMAGPESKRQHASVSKIRRVDPGCAAWTARAQSHASLRYPHLQEEKMPYRISRLGTVEIRSLDLDRDLDYYVNVLGLQLTAREGRTAYLKGWDERHAYSLMLTEADRAGMVRLAFRTVDPEDLDYYRSEEHTTEPQSQRDL